jgi:hypothetical protein
VKEEEMEMENQATCLVSKLEILKQVLHVHRYDRDRGQAY